MPHIAYERANSVSSNSLPWGKYKSEPGSLLRTTHDFFLCDTVLSYSLFTSGIITASEKKIFDDLNTKTSHPKYWMPLIWAGSIVTRARMEGRIRDDFTVKTIVDEISKFRGLCGGLLSYDWISIPLVYTQVRRLNFTLYFVDEWNTLYNTPMRRVRITTS